MAAKKTSKKKTSKKKTSRNTPAGKKDETKAEKFSRLGSMRATKAINAMRGLQKLSNKNNYEYTDEQVAKLVNRLKEELEAVHAAFTSTGGNAEDAFKL